MRTDISKFLFKCFHKDLSFLYENPNHTIIWWKRITFDRSLQLLSFLVYRR